VLVVRKATDCKDCPKRADLHCLAYLEFAKQQDRELPPEPFSGCIIPIIESYVREIKKGQSVLEVGCGGWSPIKDHCENVGAHYEGIDSDSEYMGTPTVATRVENLADLSFPEAHFDFVIGNQTMEHWAEYGCNTGWGLFQCFRVAKPGGRILLNVPIHFHGVKPFLMGEIGTIIDFFRPFSDEVTIESWGRTAAPLNAYVAHPKYYKLKNRPAYALNIVATRKAVLPRNMVRPFAFAGILARILNNPPSFLVYYIGVRFRRLVNKIT
jgi:SAM-dependent methyltransferase